MEDLALKLRGNLDSIEANALFDVPETNETTNSVVDDRGRLIPISHHIGMELYFILDASSSVGETNFESAKRFARELVKEVSINISTSEEFAPCSIGTRKEEKRERRVGGEK